MILVFGPDGCLDALTPAGEVVTYIDGPYLRTLPLAWNLLDGGLVVLVGPLRMAEYDELRWPLLRPQPDLEYLEPRSLRIGGARSNLVTILGHPPTLTAEAKLWWSNASLCEDHGWSAGPAGCERCAEGRERAAVQESGLEGLGG